MGRDGLVVARHGDRSSQFARRLERVRVAARGGLHASTPSRERIYAPQWSESFWAACAGLVASGRAAKVSKSFLGCLFVLGQPPAGSPAGRRFRDSSRPAGAAVGCRRRRRLRGSFVAACLPLLFGVPHPPETRDAGAPGATALGTRGSCSNGVLGKNC